MKTVLEGSVRKAGNRLRINAQLINAADGYHLWSERYDRGLEDVFAVQDEIARAVVEKLKVKLLGEVDASMVTRPTENLEAYNLYLKGRYYFGRLSGPTLEEAFGCYTQALALEPNYAQAHAGVASVQAARAVLSLVDPSQVLPAAKAAASRALALDETVADAHDAMGRVLQYYEWKWGEAEREYRRALELNPGDTFTRAGLAALLVQVGRADVAVAQKRGSPLSAIP